MVNQIEALRDADLVIEAVVEKKKLNSLYLSNLLKFVVRKPFCKQYIFNFSDCNFGGHYSPWAGSGFTLFNPAPVMKLVEIVQGLKPQTAYVWL